ncbi:MAG: penicillin-binding protein activator [Nanoarchaeota archaeon]
MDKDEKKNGKEDKNLARSWIWIIILGVVILGVAFFLSRSEFSSINGNVISEGSPLKVGVMVPLSGDAASYGLSVQKGIEIAKQELGMNVELIYEDSKCEGRDAVTAVNKLISVDKVHAIIGELCSGATLAAAPIAEEAGVVMVSPASTSPEITNAGDYIFRTVPSDALQGAFGAQLVFDKGYEKLAILYSNEDYGLGFSQVLEDSFEGEIIANEAFERGATDLRAQLTKIKNANSDAIYIISNSPDSAVAALKQIKQLGIKAQIFGSEGLKSQDIADGAGDAANGMILTSVSSGSTPFFKTHRRIYDRESPGPFAPQGYDALQAIVLAVERGAKKREEIKDKLYEMEFDGISGKIDFDLKGDVSGNYEVYEVRANTFVPVVEYGATPEIIEELDILLSELNVSLNVSPNLSG